MLRGRNGFQSISLSVALVSLFLAGEASAQTFAPIPGLSFTRAFGAPNPLPQNVFIASAGSNFNFFASASTSSGGSWLTISLAGGCCYTTP